MTDEWYAMIDGRLTGPLSTGELRSAAQSGILKADNLIRKSNQTVWTRVDQFAFLLPLPPHSIRRELPAAPVRQEPQSSSLFEEDRRGYLRSRTVPSVPT